jgi:hypothetical protein
VFDHAHGILVQSEMKQILSSIVEESDCKLEGEGLDDLLNEMS